MAWHGWWSIGSLLSPFSKVTRFHQTNKEPWMLLFSKSPRISAGWNESLTLKRLKYKACLTERRPPLQQIMEFFGAELAFEELTGYVRTMNVFVAIFNRNEENIKISVHVRLCKTTQQGRMLRWVKTNKQTNKQTNRHTDTHPKP